MSLPLVIHVVVCVLGAFVGGAVLGWIVGVLKARTGAHEVIVTIMLNYIMAYLLAYLLSKPSLLEELGANGNLISPNIARNAHLPLLSGTHLRINVQLPARAGLRGRCVVADEPQHAGVRVPHRGRQPERGPQRRHERVTDLDHGHADRRGLAGLLRLTVIQGTDFSLNFQSFGTYGIDAITVALLAGPGRRRRAGRAAVRRAARRRAADAGSTFLVYIVQVIQALIVMFVAAPPLVRAIYRLRAVRAGGTGQVLSKGWRG